MRLSQRVTHWRNAHRGVAGSGCGDSRTATQARQSNSVDLDKARLWSASVAVLAAKRTLRWQNSLQGDRCGVGLFSSGGGKRKMVEHERYVGISNLMLKPELYLRWGSPGRSSTWLVLMHRKPFRHQ